MTKIEALNEVRKAAKENGLTYKNGGFYRRYTNELVYKANLACAYEDCLSGYLKTVA